MERSDDRANSVLGSMPVEVVFSDYKDYGGVRFPTRIVQSQGGHPALDLTVTDVRPNGAAIVAVARVEPGPAPPSPARTDFEKIADGVFFLTGGAPWSVLVEFSDHVVVIEAPQDDARSEATIAAVRRMMPGKPIRYVVNTHHHFDHSGGLGGYIAEGIPIITHEKNKPSSSESSGTGSRELSTRSQAAIGPNGDPRGGESLRVLRDSLTLRAPSPQREPSRRTLLVAYLPRRGCLCRRMPSIRDRAQRRSPHRRRSP